MATKAKYTTFVSPIGIAKFAWLNKPDAGYDGKSTPQFKIRVLIEDTDENRAWCDSVVAQAAIDAKTNSVKLKKVFNVPFNYPEDQDEDDFVPAEGKERPKLDEDHRGRIFFDTKSQYKPAQIDTKRVALPEDVYIMSGDEVRVKFELFAYEGLGSGVSFRPKVAQLIAKNTSFSGGAVNTDGFDDVDGYEAAGGGQSSNGDEDF